MMKSELGKPLRIAIVIGKMDTGGKKSLVMEYYRHIDKSTIQFDFICDDNSHDIPYDEINSLGGRIFLAPPYQKIVKYIMTLYKIFKENHFLIMHAYNSTMNIFPLMAAKFAGVPVRISESISMANKGDSRTFLKLMLRPFSHCFATHFMACGEDCGRWQFGNKLYDSGKVALFKTAINTTQHAFDPILREMTRKKYNLSDKIVMGHIGRFVEQKNPLFMLDIIAELCKLSDKIVFLLIGDGKLKQQIIDKIDVLKIKEKVLYLGRREDINQFYQAMDAFLLPSLYEGLPVVGLDAQCAGLPVIFSDEVTREASACDLGYFISLKTSPQYWAHQILNVTTRHIPLRKSMAAQVKDHGFDSYNEAYRLQLYYLNTLYGMLNE